MTNEEKKIEEEVVKTEEEAVIPAEIKEEEKMEEIKKD
jgi:hypothetical protein